MKQQNNIFILNIHTKIDEEVKWIYESPDKGKTVYRRPFGKLGPRELIICNEPVILN